MTSTTTDEIALTNLERSRASGHEEDGQSRNRIQSSVENEQPHGQEFSLPRADGGKDAWLYLVSCFFVEALIWGKFCVILM